MNRIAVRTLVMAAGLLAAGSESPASAQPLVDFEFGDLPIILSAPHGGSAPIPGVPTRQGKGVRQFRRTTDLGTAQLAHEVADQLAERMGKRPYVVIARFHRKYLDANRRASQAYESDAAKTTYNAFHDALQKARADVARRWGFGLLLDLHGQSASPDTIFRGTQNGRTTRHLAARFGEESLVGGGSLLGRLSEQGFTVFPAVGTDRREHQNYDGGYIVQTYGSRDGGTVDAIQLELGLALRRRAAISGTARKMAAAIRDYAGEYLPSKPTPVPRDRSSRIVRVGLYTDRGAGRSVSRLRNVLRRLDRVEVRDVTARGLRGGELEDLDVLVQPGGSGSAQGRHLGEDGRTAIREFVRGGGGFVGICAGSYLASADYDWSLNLLDAKVLDRKHWARGKGTVKIEWTEAGRTWAPAGSSEQDIYYAQGPLLAPANRADIDDYQALATFRTEIAKNGAPKGVMVDTTAIALGRFGRGQVVCFSPHPELTDGLDVLLQQAINRVDKRRKHRPSAAPEDHRQKPGGLRK